MPSRKLGNCLEMGRLCAASWEEAVLCHAPAPSCLRWVLTFFVFVDFFQCIVGLVSKHRRRANGLEALKDG